MKKILFALMLAAGMMDVANAALIVDTGAPYAGGPAWGLVRGQYFGGEFSIASAQTIHSIEGYFSTYYGGNLDFAIHSTGAGNYPGSVLFTTTQHYANQTALDWHGVSGLNWDLAAGDYWVSFLPDASFSGTMPGSATSPMAQYAQGTGDYAWSNMAPGGRAYLKLGVRIDATADNAVPEPTSLALLGIGLIGFGVSRRRAK